MRLFRWFVLLVMVLGSALPAIADPMPKKGKHVDPKDTYALNRAREERGKELLAKPALTPAELTELAVILGSGNIELGSRDRAKEILGGALQRGDLGVKDALMAAARLDHFDFPVNDLLNGYYAKADPKKLGYDDYVTLILLDGSPYDGAGKILEDALKKDAPGARDALRDIISDRIPDFDIAKFDSTYAHAKYAERLVKIVGYKQYSADSPIQVLDLSIADEEALKTAAGRIKDDYQRKRILDRLDEWKVVGQNAWLRRVQIELGGAARTYVEAKKVSARDQFTALQERIRKAGAMGEIPQGQADAFRQEVFDLAAKVALENQTGGVKAGDRIITPGWLASEIVEESKTERFFWNGPSPGGTGLAVVRGTLTDLDKYTLSLIQDTAGMVLSKEERIALEDAVIKENSAAIREQMVAQMTLLSKTFEKVSEPARKPPSGPITVLQDFIKYEVGSESSYHAMVERLLPVYKDFDPMYRLIPKKGQPITGDQYREFMKRRGELVERIRGADANIAKYLESQKEWKDNITSIGAVTAAAALAIPTGGQSLWITVPVLAGGGAVTKVGLSWGDDYLGGRDYTLKDGFKDGIIGAVDGIGVLAGGSLSTAARNAVGKRIGLGLLEKGLQRELNMQGATILQRFLVHGVTTTSRGATFGALTGFTRKTYDVVDRINAGKESFGLHTLGEIASATALSAGGGAILDFGLSSTFMSLGKLLPKRAPNAPLDPEVEGILWRMLGAEKGDAAAATAAIKRKFPGGFEANGAISQEQSLALEAYSALIKGKGWTGDAAAMKLEVLAAKVSPYDTIAFGDTVAPSPEVFRMGSQVRVPRSSGAVDEGWRIDSINADGSVKVSSPAGSKTMSPSKVLEYNPELLRGVAVRTTRTNGAVEENWVVDSIDKKGNIKLTQPSTGLARGIPASGVKDFIAQNADRWSPSSMSKLLPEQLKLAEAKVPVGPARDVSLEFKANHRLEGQSRIPDGYVDGGRGMSIASDGTAASGRELIVVDRARDPALRRYIDVAKDLGAKVKAGQMSEEAAYRELAQTVDRLLSPGGNRDLAHGAMDRWLKFAEGREILLGDVVRTEAGMCRHRSLLFKVLGDELAVASGGKSQVALVRGNLVWPGGQGGHAWNELVLSDGRKVLVDVMNPSPGFKFPTLENSAGAYRRVDNSPFYAAAKPTGNQTLAFDPNKTMVDLVRPDSALLRARALADVLDTQPIGSLTTKETVWAAIRAAEEKGVGDLYRAQIKDQLIAKLDGIERIRALPNRQAEASAEMANLTNRAKSAGFSVDEISAALGAQREAATRLAGEVATAKAAGFKEYPKHLRGKTDAEAQKLSTAKEGGDPVGQYATRYGNNAAGDAARAELERAALLDPRAIRVQTGGALHVYYEAAEVVGFSNGQPTKWLRVELSGNTIHSHPRAPEIFPKQAAEQYRIKQIFEDNAKAPMGAIAMAAPPPAPCKFAAAPPAP